MEKPTWPVGFPAITPRISPASPTAPAFTEQDVIDFVRAHPAPARRLHPDGPVVVESVTFLPARDLHERLRTSTGAPDETRLCLVELRGSFTFVGMRGMAPIQTTRAIQVFDAQTGYLLMGGSDLR